MFRFSRKNHLKPPQQGHHSPVYCLCADPILLSRVLYSGTAQHAKKTTKPLFLILMFHKNLTMVIYHHPRAWMCTTWTTRPFLRMFGRIQIKVHIGRLVQDYSNSSALARELLQSCTKPLICLPSGKFIWIYCTQNGHLNTLYTYFHTSIITHRCTALQLLKITDTMYTFMACIPTFFCRKSIAQWQNSLRLFTCYYEQQSYFEMRGKCWWWVGSETPLTICILTEFCLSYIPLRYIMLNTDFSTEYPS